MKRTLQKIILGTAIVLNSLGTSYATYPDAEFITYGNHMKSIKKELKKRDEKIKEVPIGKAKKDYDGDNIKDISVLTENSRVYFVSSKDVKGGKSTEKKWVWYGFK